MVAKMPAKGLVIALAFYPWEIEKILVVVALSKEPR